MTDKELERLLRQKEDSCPPPRTNVSLVLSPHIVRTAAHLRKRRRDRLQTALCALAAVIFLLSCVLIFFLWRRAENPADILRYVGMTAAGGMVIFLICAPALVWHEENA